MKRVKTILALAVMVLLAGVDPAQADNFVVDGPGTQIGEAHSVTGVSPNENISVTIYNGRLLSACSGFKSTPGYSAFLAYIEGNGVIVGAAYTLASSCIGGVCILTVHNNTTDITANELYVVGYGGKGSTASACVMHD